jgi:cell division protease FtsH
VFLGREIAQHRDYSEATAQKIDTEITRLIKATYDKAKSVLKEHMDILHALAELLLEKETVLGRELDELILKVRPGIELPAQAGDDEEEEVQEAQPKSAPAMKDRPDEKETNG